MTINPFELTNGKLGTPQLITEIIRFNIVITHNLNSHWHEGTVSIQVLFIEQSDVASPISW